MAAVAAAHRLRHPVRRQQHLCQRPQSRLGRVGLSRRVAAGRHRRNPSGRSQRRGRSRRQHAAHRRSRLARHRRSVGALPGGARAVRPGSDPDRMGQRRADRSTCCSTKQTMPRTLLARGRTGGAQCRRCLNCSAPCGASLVGGDTARPPRCLRRRRAADRLDIYRNTFVSGVTKALRLAFPGGRTAGRRRILRRRRRRCSSPSIRPARPGSTEYGGANSRISCGAFRRPQSLVYLGDVARLEWAVNRALHAADVEPLDLARLAALTPRGPGARSFVPHPVSACCGANYPGRRDLARAFGWRRCRARRRRSRRRTGAAAGRTPCHRHRRYAPRRSRLAFRGGAVRGLGDRGGARRRRRHRLLDALLAEHLAAGRFVDFRLAPAEPRASVSRSDTKAAQ